MTKFLIGKDPFPDAHRLYIHFNEDETDIFSIELSHEELKKLYEQVGNYLLVTA
jgi:hypothetical protein